MTVRIPAVIAAVLLTIPVSGADKDAVPVAKGNVVLWRAPDDIGTRDLINGIGGPEHVPHGPFTFVKEDLNGTSPKFTVHDSDGVKWKVKLGLEAKPETAATRIVWAAGYYTTEDYYLPTIQVNGMPPQLHRGQLWVYPDGVMRGARLKREGKGAEKEGTWKWKNNPFSGTREFNGLRALMGLINNWDVKDVNNAVYKEHGELRYIVSDLGGSLGAPGLAWPTVYAKGNLDQYNRARFVCKTRTVSVDFCSPARSAIARLVDPKGFLNRRRLEWVGHDVPRADARWMGEILARLSPRQIRDAFRAAGYAPDEVEGYARVLERRIGELLEM